MIIIKVSKNQLTEPAIEECRPSAMSKIIPENYSGWETNWKKHILSLQKRNFIVLTDKSIGGDAPKNFIKVYEFGVNRREKKSNWTAYIAKAAYKWYPNENITEYLMNRIGQVLGLKMADSKLVMVGEEIRFLSRYFLKQNEQLIHGAQIYAAYLMDERFVQDVEKQKLESSLFPFQEAEKAILSIFPEYGPTILEEFVKLLIFDALVGNSDRHFYNWGVITHISGSKPPIFSPIYDTARGLLWNESENRLEKISKSTLECGQFIQKYVNKSKPKIGWEGVAEINHFNFIEKLLQGNEKYQDICISFLTAENKKAMLCVLNQEFSNLFSQKRKELIQQCLELRFETLCQIFQNKKS